MALRFDRRGGTDVRGYGQAEETAAVTAALDGASPSLLPYYLMAVAAGVTVWFITQKVFGKKR